jgi:hypothetical protein
MLMSTSFASLILMDKILRRRTRGSVVFPWGALFPAPWAMTDVHKKASCSCNDNKFADATCHLSRYAACSPLSGLREISSSGMIVAPHSLSQVELVLVCYRAPRYDLGW